MSPRRVIDVLQAGGALEFLESRRRCIAVGVGGNMFLVGDTVRRGELRFAMLA